MQNERLAYRNISKGDENGWSTIVFDNFFGKIGYSNSQIQQLHFKKRNPHFMCFIQPKDIF